MDKLRLFTSKKTAIPKHILETKFSEPFAVPIPNSKYFIYHLHSLTNGVHLTSTPKGVTITTNPTKYLTGHNLNMINRTGLMDFTDRISEDFKTDFGCWDVSQFDYNSDLAMQHKPELYFELLGRLKQWKCKGYDGTGVNYSNSYRALTFYNQYKLCKKDHETLPENNKKIRIEASVNQKLNMIKELQNMKTLNDYITANNYQQLPQLWLNAYEQVEKNEPVVYIPNLTKKENDILAAIQQLTLNGYRNKLRVEYPKQYRYHNAILNGLLERVREYQHQQKSNNLTLSLIDELNNKVRARAKELIENS